MSSLIKRNRNIVAAIAALVLILVPLKISPASAEGASNDTSLSVFTVDGNPVVDDQTVTLEPGTTSVAVVATPTDPAATYEITGATGLVAGDNPLVVSVLAADGVTTGAHSVNLFVQSLSSDASLKTFTINGNPVVDGDDVYLAHGTTSVTAVVETTDLDATYTITGTTDLVDGDNPVLVTVTAVDGTIATYSVNLAVALSSDASLATFQVNGENVVDGSVVELPALTEEVDVLIETTDLDAIYEITGDTNLLGGENTLEVTVTAADGETTETYFVTLNVAFNTDTNVNRIMIDGVEVVDGESVDLEPLTVSVEVDVETADANATFEVTGDTDLVPGENTLTILVTAADSITTAEYTVTLNVLVNNDTSLATLQVNGTEVEDGGVVVLDPLTTSVDVFVETTDENATTEVIGDTELVVGENQLEIVVTAADGETTQTYAITLQVLPNTDFSADILIEGEAAVDGDIRVFDWGVTEVAVDVLTADPDATFSITGETGLVVGENELSIIITAADGESYQTITITIVVLPNTDATLSLFQINGLDVEDGDVLDVVPLTSSVAVEVETNDPEATYEITGDADLIVGENQIVVSVLAADGVTLQDYLVTIVVPLNDDTSITSWLIDGSEVSDGDIIELPALTGDVDVVVETNDPDASVEIDGANTLVVGENTLTVTVTAVDGETTATYSVTLIVAPNDDTSLALFQINDTDVADGDSIELEPGATAVAITVETTDPEATYEIFGDTDLLIGENELIVSVLAADGVTVQDYLVTIIVPLNNDASIESILVDGSEISAGDSIDLAPYTADVDVDVETTDPEATFEVDGNHGLVEGENTVIITVIAADGETTESYEFTLVVAVSDDVSLSFFQVNELDVVDGDVVEVEPGSTDVEVDVETTDANAVFTVVGDTGLLPGENDLIVSVVAADGVTVRDYLVTIVVPLSDDTGVESILVDGTEVSADESLDLDPFTSDVDVEVVTSDPDATFEVVGSVGLVAGENVLSIIVTAADGETTETFEVILVVAFNNDTSLAFFQVNGVDVADGDSVETEPGASDVLVDVETSDPDATFEVEGDMDLVAGDNTLVVTVTAADGETVAVYSVGVFVPLNDDASVTSILVNGDQVYDGDALELAPYTTEVELEVVTTDPDATFDAQGLTDLVVGDNTLTITVTAADGTTTQTFEIILNVALGDDASLSVFQVDGEDVENGQTITVDPKTTAVEVTVETTDPEATFEITGNEELMEGLNEVVVLVTAQNGEDVMEYSVIVEVPANNDTSAAITVDGSDVVDGDIVILPAGTTDVDVEVETTDPDADVVIDGNFNLTSGDNTLTVTVIAADGTTTQTFEIILNVAVSDDVSLSFFQVNELDVVDGDVVEVEPGSTDVEVDVETTDANAVFTVVGDTGLLPGENDLIVSVVAADGVTVRDYLVTIVVPLSDDTGVESILVDGTEVSADESLDLDPFTSDVDVEVVTSDPDATFEVVGSVGLVAGENVLSIIVTAADGEAPETFEVILVVAFNNDTSLAFFQVNGVDVADGDSVETEPGASDVLVDVETSDPDATFEVEGDMDLVAGDNTLVVTVTAADGETVAVYSVGVFVPLNDDASVTSILVNGDQVYDGDALELAPYTTEVELEVVTTDPDATFDAQGLTDLVVGDNTLTITVTAADGTTTQTFEIILNVALGDDASLSVFQVDGEDVENGQTITVDPKTTAVEVTVETTDPEATFEITGNEELMEGLNEVVVLVTAQNGEDVMEYSVIVEVPANNDTSAAITVDGSDVVDGDIVILPAGTTDVDVEVETTDPDADVVIDGNFNLTSGDNTLTVTVIAADGTTTQTFEIILNVAVSDDVSLSFFQVNELDVVDGDVVEVEPGSTDVEVDVETTDANAVFTVVGDTGLLPGENDLIVSVVAADGVTVRDYLVTIVVPLSDDTGVESILVDGTEVSADESLDLDPFTSDVDVEVVTSDPDATFEVVGSVGLVAGENVLSIIVTAADGETTETFEVILVVAFNNDTSLAFFQVNGVDVADGDSVETEPGASDVLVDVETSDPDATFEVEGDMDLVAGDNTLVVTVTAADGETVAVYSVGVFVPLNDDASVTSILVNGDQVYDGDALELAPYTTEVELEVVTTDPDATFDAQGLTDLVVGDNTLTITVTAADGTTTQTFEIILNVALGDDASLSVFQVDGEDVENGQTITVDPKTTAVEVTVETTDPEATFEITGNEELMEGLNEVVVLVTAQNGEDVMEYSVIVEVPANNDTSAAITVDGSDVVDGDIVILPAGTTDVDVEVETTDPDADVVIDGNFNLTSGENSLSITVVAADGTTSQLYNITLVVLPNDDTSLAVFQINDQDVQDGDTIELDVLTTEVGITVETTNPDATYEITGDSDLLPGVNTLTVTVTAADGVTIVEYNITLLVALGNSTELSVFTVAGADVTDGDTIDLAPGTSDVEVEIEAEDPNATVTWIGDSGLTAGENTLVVTVVSADESETAEYTIILNVLLGNDVTLSTFTIDGNDVADGDVVDLAPGQTSVDVEVITTDESATFEISGDTDLSIGENTLTVTVTAEDGETVAEYTITLVATASDDVSLAVFEVNGTEVADGETLDLDSNMTEVFIRVETNDPEAAFEIVGGTDLVKGENTLVVTVTAADGETTAEYTVTLYVPSDDASVSSILVNGVVSVSGDIITVEPGSESVDVEVNVTDENAKVEIKGADALVEGENEILVIVTAEDGIATQEFSFTVRVGGQSADTTLNSLTVNGTEVSDGDTINLPSRTTSVNVVAVTRDPAATVKITGRTGLVVGKNTIQVMVTAPDLKTVRYIYITAVVAPLSSNTDLSEFSINGVNVVDKGTIALPPLTRGVSVIAKAADAEATIVVSGKSVVDGSNTLTVTVTAANGTVRIYTVTMVVRVLSADTSLKTFTINGADASTGTFRTAPSATSVNVVAIANDPQATVSIVGAASLRVGVNTVSVLVTAENGTSKTYQIVVTVPASNNAGLKSLSVNGVDSVVGSRVVLPRGTKSAVVKAVASDLEAKVLVAGGLNLVSGDNSVLVTVTAPDGVTVATYALTLYVTPPSSDKSLKSFKINGLTVVDGGTLTVPALTTSVTVEALTTDPEASVVVAGRSQLSEGVNTVSVTVTAADLSTKTYLVTVRVLSLSSDNTLKSLKVNGVEYTGGTIQLAYGVRSIVVLPVVNDLTASAAIIGNGALRTGPNTVIVRVTAANGAIADTSIFVNVAKSNNTSLTALTMNGVDALPGTTITQPVRTTLATVKAVTADPEATVVVTSTTLAEGNNKVVVTITAPDGTVRIVNIPVYVTPLSSNTNLSTFRVNNISVLDGSSIDVANKTLSVPVSVIPADSESIVVVSGSSALRTGINTVTVTVTAPNGLKKIYTVTVVVLKSSNTALTSLTVNGLDASSGSTVTLPVRTTSAVVKAVTSDPEAVAVASNTSLAEGSNTVTLTITAPDGTVRLVSIPVYVTPLSSNTNLSVLKVNNVTVVDGGSINVANKTLSVPVVATAADAEAVVAVTGNSALKTGINTVSILVTAPNGLKKIYTVTVVVLKSSNTALTSLTVNGLDASSGSTVTLPVRTTSAVVKAVTSDPEAVAVASNTSLAEGGNTVTLTITAPDGTVRLVSIPVYVTPLSSNTNLSVLKVNNVTVVDGGSINVANKTLSVPVVATAADAEAVVAVTGNSALKTGINTVSILVTAPNGLKKIYTVTVVVLKSSNTDLNSLTVNGSAVVAGGTVTLPVRSTSAVVKAVTSDPEASVVVSGASGLSSGVNSASVTVTAADGTSRKIDFTLYVTPLSGDNTLKSLTVNGAAYVADSTVELPLGSASVAVVAVANDASASVEVSGNTALVGGVNTITVKVTAANGDVRNYTAKVNVPVRSSNANISTVAGTWTINGVDVSAIASDAVAVELPAGATAVTATAKTEDTKATIVISGTTGLVTDLNTITFTVTAEDGVTVKTYTRKVNVKPLSSNTKITSLTIAGQSVVDGDTLNLVAGTTRVEVIPLLESPEARFTVTGNSGLDVGVNTVEVLVTAPSGANATTTVTVIVAAPASNTSLSTFVINETAVVNGSTITVALGTTRLHVSAIPTDPTASVTVQGRSGLTTGTNFVVVTVTALSGDTSTYTVTVNVGE